MRFSFFQFKIDGPDYRKIFFFGILFFIVFNLGCSQSKFIGAGNKGGPVSDVSTKIANKIKTTNVPFIKNQGQKNENVLFYSGTFGGTVYVTRTGQIVYALPKNEKKDDNKLLILKETIPGFKAGNIRGENKSITKINYFKGRDQSKWIKNASTYDAINMGEIAPGVELKLKAHGDNVEKLFLVKAGADPKDIKINMSGENYLIKNKNGELYAMTDLGPVLFTKPVAYQEKDGVKTYVNVEYGVNGKEYGFIVGHYNKNDTLIIDPLLASTLIGSPEGDKSFAIAKDSDGNIYIAGNTRHEDFPVTAGAFQEDFYGGEYQGEPYGDAFISKFNSDLTELIASTFLGGDGGDVVYSIALESEGDVVVAGCTWSPEGEILFPTTNDAYQGFKSGNIDAFVSRLSNDLSSLEASTYIGGSDVEGHTDGISVEIVLDSSNNVYITGCTKSRDYPITPAAFQTINGDGFAPYYDAFVSKFNSSLTTLIASTYLGGFGEDKAFDIALDNDGNVYVTGETQASNFPTSDGAYDEIYNGGNFTGDVFIAKLSNDLTELQASTYIGGSGDDKGTSIVVDGEHLYVAGFAEETQANDFPTIIGCYDTSHNGDLDVFVAKLNNDLTELSASTFLGGTEIEGSRSLYDDEIWSVVALTKNDENLYITGATESADFPMTPDAYQAIYAGEGDGFIAKFDSSLVALLYSTFLGGAACSDDPPAVAWDEPQTILVDVIGSSEKVYISGFTESSDYPTTDGAYDTEYTGGWGDAFVSILELQIPPLTITATSGNGGAIDPAGEVIVEHGAEQAFVITADEYYHINDVLVDGISIPSENDPLSNIGVDRIYTYTYTFEDVTEDHTIQAEFAGGDNRKKLTFADEGVGGCFVGVISQSTH